MPLLEIKKYGCPVLRRRAEQVTSFDDEIKSLVDDMFETMFEAKGVGLAAPQVGVLRRVIVVDIGPYDPAFVPLALVNPEVLAVGGEIKSEEGCLSFPGQTAPVKRPARAIVRGLAADGKPVELDLADITARVILHEIDHLDGILFIDHVPTLSRQMMRGALRKLQKEGGKQSWEKRVVEALPVTDLT